MKVGTLVRKLEKMPKNSRIFIPLNRQEDVGCSAYYIYKASYNDDAVLIAHTKLEGYKRKKYIPPKNSLTNRALIKALEDVPDDMEVCIEWGYNSDVFIPIKTVRHYGNTIHFSPCLAISKSRSWEYADWNWD